MPTGTQQYDVMVAVNIIEHVNDYLTVPSGWTEIVDQVHTFGNHRLYVHYKIAGASESGPYSFDCGIYEQVTGIATFRNVNQSSPIGNTSSIDNDSGTANTAPGITINAVGEMLLHIGSASYGTTRTSPAGFDGEAFDHRNGTAYNNVMAAMSYDLRSSTGSTGDIDATLANGDYNCGSLVALKPA